MRIGYYIFCAAIIAACEAKELTTPQQPQSVEAVAPQTKENKKPFEIGGVSLFMKASDLRLKLGEPLAIKPIAHFCIADERCEDWEYEGASFFLVKGEVSGVNSSSPTLCLWDSLCPGDSLESAFALLGDSEIWPASTDKPARLEYHVENNVDACWLWLYLNDEEGVVTELILACQP